MPAFKDDQLLIIAPGSRETLAQLGLPESLAPAKRRFRSRMFQSEVRDQYEPHKVRPKPKPKPAPSATNGAADAPAKPDEPEFEEDKESEEGAVWPIQAGRIANWACLAALLTHVWNTINPPFHTPVLLVAEPAWTLRDHERIAQFFFEKFKIPAFAIVDAAVAVTYGLGLENAAVVDVGYDKADVSAVAGFNLYTTGRAIAVPDCGGRAMTQRLLSLLEGKGFTWDMCEQLKATSICEVLPSDADIPTQSDHSADKTAPPNPAIAASTAGNEPAATATVDGTRAAGEGAGVDKGNEDDNEGVLDIASIVTGGKMNEFIESKEKEKAEKAAAKKKGGEAAANTAKPVRLPNAKRLKNTFIYDDHALHDALKGMNTSGEKIAEIQAAVDAAAPGRKAGDEANGAGVEAAAKAGTIRREIEVGTERFQAAGGGVLDRLADAVHRTISAVEDIERRAELWNSLAIVGNGARVRGFKEALLARLQSKYQISPSSATIFTSELPSSMSTPMATGMNTPQAPGPAPLGGGGGGGGGSGVNPLLMAATTGQSAHLHGLGHAGPGGGGGGGGIEANRHHSHGQTPTSIKMVKIPEYFPEWKEAGYEEAAFLGAQVAAKVVFTQDLGQSKAYMTRTDYNDQGPQGVHEFSL